MSHLGYGPYTAAQPVATPGSSSMSSPTIVKERILARVGSGTTARSSSRILSNVNSGGRIRLDQGEGSVRFSEDSALNVGQEFGENSEITEESTGESEKFSVETSETIPLVPPAMPVSPPRCVVSRENERPVRNYRDVKVKFQSWDGMKNIVKGVWILFMNWNNRRTLKKIKGSLYVLRTYHDAVLHGEVPLNLQARTRIRAGWIGFLWHVVEFLLGVISATLYVYSTYHKEAEHNWIADVQKSISCAFLADYLFRLYTESSRFFYVFSLWGAVDFLSLMPVILIFRCTLNVRWCFIYMITSFQVFA